MCTSLSKIGGIEPALRGARVGWEECGTGDTLRLVAFWRCTFPIASRRVALAVHGSGGGVGGSSSPVGSGPGLRGPQCAILLGPPPPGGFPSKGQWQKQVRWERAGSEKWGGHSEPVPRISVPSPDLPCVPTLLSTDTSVEGSAHPARDGADQQAASVLWRLLGSEALGPSPGDFPNTRQSEPPAFEEAASQIPGTPGKGQ